MPCGHKSHQAFRHMCLIGTSGDLPPLPLHERAPRLDVLPPGALHGGQVAPQARMLRQPSWDLCALVHPSMIESPMPPRAVRRHRASHMLHNRDAFPRSCPLGRCGVDVSGAWVTPRHTEAVRLGGHPRARRGLAYPVGRPRSALCGSVAAHGCARPRPAPLPLPPRDVERGVPLRAPGPHRPQHVGPGATATEDAARVCVCDGPAGAGRSAARSPPRPRRAPTARPTRPAPTARGTVPPHRGVHTPG